MTFVFAGFVDEVDKLHWSRMMAAAGFEGSTGLTVAAAAGDRNITIGTGYITAAGAILQVTATHTVNFTANASGNPRIDRIVARFDWGSNTADLFVVVGTPGASPIPPTLTRTVGTLWHATIAQVLINNGQGTLSSGNLTREAVPFDRGFHNITSIATAPDPAANPGLIYYTPAKSLRVVESGTWQEIAHLRGVMQPVQDSDTTMSLITNTTADPTDGSPTLPRVAVSFIAPDSGKVYVTVSGYINATQDGQSAWMSFQMRTGGTLGSGTEVVAPLLDRAIITSSAVNAGSEALFGGSFRHLVTGLTPGNTFNVQTMHAVGGLTGRVNNRAILVEPVM